MAQQKRMRRHGSTDAPSGPDLLCGFGAAWRRLSAAVPCCPSQHTPHARAPTRARMRALASALRRAVHRAAFAGGTCGTIVRSVPSRRVQHQHLPAGLIEDRPRGGVHKCGIRHRHISKTSGNGDEPFLPERLLRGQQQRKRLLQVQRPPDGRREPCHAAAVRRCALPRTLARAPVSVACP